jgi:hypothetical protein
VQVLYTIHYALYSLSWIGMQRGDQRSTPSLRHLKKLFYDVDVDRSGEI